MIPTCNICKEEYTDENGIRVPKTLACDHSLCLDCAKKWVKNQEISCPACRAITRVEGNDVTKLRKNFGLMDAVDKATFKMGQMKKELQSVTPPNCKAHPYNLAEFVCVSQTCAAEDKLMCRTCDEFGVHKGHKKGLLLDDLENTRKSLREVQKSINDTIQRIEKLSKDLKENQETYKKTSAEYMKITNEINSHFEKIRRKVDEKQENVLQKLRDSVKKQCEKIETRISELDYELESKTQEKTRVDDFLNRSNAELPAQKVEIENFKRTIRPMSMSAEPIQPITDIHVPLPSFCLE